MATRIDVAMAITRHSGTGDFLLLRKNDTYGGRYDRTPWEVPGGKIESADFAACDRDPDSHGHGSIPAAVVAAAAQRELAEETGLDGAVQRQESPYNSRQSDGDEVKDISFYPVLLSVSDRSITLNPDEHSDYVWMEREQVDDYLTEHEMNAFDRLDL